MGSYLKVFPRYVDVFMVEQFRALFFNVSKKAEKTLFDSYTVDQET